METEKEKAMSKYLPWNKKKKRKPRHPEMSLSEAGRLGGIASARSSTKKQKQEWGRKGGKTTYARYGPDFYRKIAIRKAKIEQDAKPKPRKSRDGLFLNLKRGVRRKVYKATTT